MAILVSILDLTMATLDSILDLRMEILDSILDLAQITLDSTLDLEMVTLDLILGMEMVAIKDTILAMAISTLLYLDLEVASMCVKIGLTDVGYNNLHIMEVCSMEAVDQDKDVELAAASDQPVEETTGNMVAMETVSVVAMVEDGDIILDMDTIHQSTFHHRMDLLV